MSYLNTSGLERLWQHIISRIGRNTDDLIERLYPVGSIYISMNASDPFVSLGIGQWERILGRFLLSADDDHAVGSIGGEEAHVLTVNELPTHGHNATISEAGAHIHSIGTDMDVAYTSSGKCCSVHKAEEGAEQFNGRTNETGTHTHEIAIEPSGGGWLTTTCLHIWQ